MKSRRIKWLTLVGGIGLASLIWVLSLSSAPPTEPKITWSESQVEVILSPGESTSRNLSFISSLDLSAVVIEPVPELAPFLSIEPSRLGAIPANQTQSVLISVLVPEGTVPGTYEGTVQVRTGRQTLPQTLKVQLDIWPRQTLTDSGIKISYPPSMTATTFPATSGTQTSIFARPDGVGFSVESVDTSSSGTTLLEWADAQNWPFPDSYRNHFSITVVAGTVALRDPATGSVILKVGQKVLFVDNGLGREDRLLLDASTFQAILDSIRVP